MIQAGLSSTQLRIRQSTYRFLLGGTALSGVRWLSENDGVSLVAAMHKTQQEFEADVYTPKGKIVDQIHDMGMILDHFVEYGLMHPTTLKPRVGKVVEWIWYDPDGKEFGLGVEELLTRAQFDKAVGQLNERVNSRLIVLI